MHLGKMQAFRSQPWCFIGCESELRQKYSALVLLSFVRVPESLALLRLRALSHILCIQGKNSKKKSFSEVARTIKAAQGGLRHASNTHKVASLYCTLSFLENVVLTTTTTINIEGSQLLRTLQTPLINTTGWAHTGFLVAVRLGQATIFFLISAGIGNGD